MSYSVLLYILESIAEKLLKEVQNRRTSSAENCQRADLVSQSRKQFLPEDVWVELHIKEGVEGIPELSRKLD